MRIKILFLIIVLFSSCNLFRKVNKETSKTKESNEIVQKAETRAQEVINNSVQNDIKTNTIVNSDELLIVYGKGLTVHPDGTVTGADSVRRFSNKNITENKEDLSKSNTSSVKDSVSNSENKETNNKIAGASNTESTTDWKLYVFLFVVLVVIGIVLWLRFK